jgi:hypothetical protein
MISLPGVLWGYFGSLGMPPEKEQMKSPTSSQGVVWLGGLLGLSLSLSWGFLGRI